MLKLFNKHEIRCCQIFIIVSVALYGLALEFWLDVSMPDTIRVVIATAFVMALGLCSAQAVSLCQRLLRNFRFGWLWSMAVLFTLCPVLLHATFYFVKLLSTFFLGTALNRCRKASGRKNGYFAGRFVGSAQMGNGTARVLKLERRPNYLQKLDR